MARHYQPLGKILVFILGFFPSLMKARDKHRNYTIEKTERRLAMPETGRKDFISYILRHLDDDKGMTIPEITNTSGLLILAGMLPENKPGV
jgi:cytochrome P450